MLALKILHVKSQEQSEVGNLTRRTLVPTSAGYATSTAKRTTLLISSLLALLCSRLPVLWTHVFTTHAVTLRAAEHMIENWPSVIS